MDMRGEENLVILKPVVIEALQALNGIGVADAEAIYGELSTPLRQRRVAEEVTRRPYPQANR